MIFLELPINQEEVFLSQSEIEFFYQFQIITVRDVTITGLFALIGGYFGLFVGVSLMQVPEIIISLIDMLKIKNE